MCWEIYQAYNKRPQPAQCISNTVMFSHFLLSTTTTALSWHKLMALNRKCLRLLVHTVATLYRVFMRQGENRKNFTPINRNIIILHMIRRDKGNALLTDHFVTAQIDLPSDKDRTFK